MATSTDKITFSKWLENTSTDGKSGRGMTLVTAGQSGVGKSTLVQNLLRVADNAAKIPEAGQSPDSVTKDVKSFPGNINGVDITIVDMPGLAAASDDEEKETIAELIKVTKEGADMLLYCANMGPSGKINELDRKIVKLLTSVFTPEIWKRAILVLTFGNIVKERNLRRGTTAETPTVEAAMNKYAEAFEKILVNLTAQVKVIPVLKGEGAERRPAKEVAAVVSGETPSEEVLPGIKWNESVYKEVLKKCKRDAVPLILRIIESIPDYVEKEAHKGAKYGTVGGVISGAVAGASIGFFAGGIGALPGAIGGGAIGSGVGGFGGRISTRAIYYQIAYNRYLESDEFKLRKEIKELYDKKIREEQKSKKTK